MSFIFDTITIFFYFITCYYDGKTSKLVEGKQSKAKQINKKQNKTQKKPLKTKTLGALN